MLTCPDLSHITSLLSPCVQYSILADIKRVCLSKDVLAALMSLSAGPLSRHPRMSEEDHQTLQLLLTFFRNLVSIPDPPAAAGTAAGAAAQNSMQVGAQPGSVHTQDHSIFQICLLPLQQQGSTTHNQSFCDHHEYIWCCCSTILGTGASSATQHQLHQVELRDSTSYVPAVAVVYRTHCFSTCLLSQSWS